MATVTAALVKELRERTGAGMMECKKALVEANADIELAIENMRKSGQAKAAKKAGRIAAEGVILTKVEAGRATMLELNCETDFVARDEGFLKFGNELLEVAAANNINDIEALNDAEMNGAKVSEVRDALVAKIGENISPRRVLTVEGNNLGAYTHGARIGVLAILEGGEEELAKDVAMHVAAANPAVVNPEDVDEATVEKEKEIFTAQAKESGKPDNVIEKMIEGRMKKYLSEITLVNQAFVVNPDLTVGKAAAEAGAEITGFVCLEVGEGIEVEKEDFAAEVAKAAQG